MSGGRVLDVATGDGAFIRFLLDGLRDHGEIVGIDTDGARAGPFADAFGDRPDVRFERMDAYALAVPDASFDTVCISNSLHHFVDPLPVLAEMRRVLRSGGRLVINEMYRDGQSEAQMTHVLLHHWLAAVNMLHGDIHRETYRRETYRRAELVGVLEGLGLSDLRLVDIADPDQDPCDPATLADLEAVIDRYLALADGSPDLIARGEMLRTRLRAVGVRDATQLVAVGRV